MTKRTELKKGDRVKFVRVAEDYEGGLAPEIGALGTVREVDDPDILIDFDDAGMCPGFLDGEVFCYREELCKLPGGKKDADA